MRRLMLLAIVFVCTSGTPSLLAHEKYRIVGVLVKVAATEVVIKTKDEHRFTVYLEDKTIYQRDKKKIAKPVLKVGQSVVVDALGDGDEDLGAVVVNLVPALKSAPAAASKSPSAPRK